MRINRYPWPKISIVTPSFNQGRFLEETILSVIQQGYPNLQYIIIDGGSTDESLDIIRKYEGHLSYWESRPDKGQAHALNKGFGIASGAIWAYLNSDDTYLPGALHHVAKVFENTKAEFVVGRRSFPLPICFLLRRHWWKWECMSFARPFLLARDLALETYNLPQECAFWKRELVAAHRFNEDREFCVEFDLFSRILPGATIAYTSRKIGNCRMHPDSKSSRLPLVGARELGEIMAQLETSGHLVGPDVAENIYSRCKRAQLGALAKRVLTLRDACFVYKHP